MSQLSLVDWVPLKTFQVDKQGDGDSIDPALSSLSLSLSLSVSGVWSLISSRVFVSHLFWRCCLVSPSLSCFSSLLSL